MFTIGLIDNNQNSSNVYFDFTCISPYTNKYIKEAGQLRLSHLKNKETEKREKYKDYTNEGNFIPLVIDIHGSLGKEFKEVLKCLAEVIALRKSQHYPYVMHNIRSAIVAELQQINADMLKLCIPF